MDCSNFIIHILALIFVLCLVIRYANLREQKKFLLRLLKLNKHHPHYEFGTIEAVLKKLASSLEIDLFYPNIKQTQKMRKIRADRFLCCLIDLEVTELSYKVISTNEELLTVIFSKKATTSNDRDHIKSLQQKLTKDLGFNVRLKNTSIKD